MPNVIVTCTFNPPSITIQGANIRQDTIDALQRALPKQTTTSQPTQRTGETAKFLLTSGNGNATGNQATIKRIEGEAGEAGPNNAPSANDASEAAANEANPAEYKSWRIDLGQHYCDQKGRAMTFLVITEALQEEGFALRGTHTVVTEKEKDVTRMIFTRS